MKRGRSENRKKPGGQLGLLSIASLECFKLCQAQLHFPSSYHRNCDYLQSRRGGGGGGRKVS